MKYFKKPNACLNHSPFVLLIGLGTHSLFEGIALGISRDMDKTVLFIIAIFMHKGAAGMSLGISIAKAFPNRNTFNMKLLAIFSIFTPLGILIGLGLNDSSEMVEIFFSCLAAGTFLYIACSEVIVDEFSQPHNKKIKLLFFIIGIGLITCLKFLDPN